MKKEIKVEDKVITLFYENNKKELPVVILNTVQDEGSEVWECCKKVNCNNFILAAVSNINWNHDMSPYPIEKISKDDIACSGGADNYIKLLTNKIMPKIKENANCNEFILAGYSLAGLFALYSCYKTDAFSKLAIASGSFWYPDFIEFVKKNKLVSSLKEIYFSLGNKESHTTNKFLKLVEENTKWLENFYGNKGIETIYVENEGNHFKEPNERMAKAIKWILEEK